MHWIVNQNLKQESGYADLIQALQDQRVPYTLVRKPPMADYLVAMHDEYDANGDNKPVALGISGPVFVCGTTSMQAVAAAHGWAPGYISAPGVQECDEHWHPHMLNGTMLIRRLDEAGPPWREFFVRPESDGKAFAGTVVRAEEWDSWRAGMLAIDTWTTVPPDTRVIMCPVQEVGQEYRCLVVHGRLVTASTYPLSSRRPQPTLEDWRAVERFVQARAAQWCPRPAFIMDVAETKDGLKIVETNSVSASGFYNMEMAKYVWAITNLEESA